MKTLMPFILGIVLIFISGISLLAQCAGGALPFTLTYDTTVTGNGNSSRLFTFPKFNPSLGTLLSADLKSVVNLSYSYTLQNTGLVTRSYNIKILRTDDITSSALDPSPVSTLNPSPVVTSVLAPSQQLNYGPGHMSYMVNNSVTDGRMINFMGAGTVDFDYETGTSAFVSAPLPYILNFNAAADTTVFSVTYRYCAVTLLSSDLLFFTAIPQSKNNVLLNWRQANMEPNRVYNVQVSIDGKTFTSFSKVTENNITGIYNYTYLNSFAKKLFFRIQEKNVSGEVKYSNIRMVEFSQDTKGIVHIFPTLYTGGNLQVNFPEKSDWGIILYAADGRKISERRQEDVYTAQLQIPGSFGNGIYIVETFNIHSRQRQITRIIVQR